MAVLSKKNRLNPPTGCGERAQTNLSSNVVCCLWCVAVAVADAVAVDVAVAVAVDGAVVVAVVAAAVAVVAAVVVLCGCRGLEPGMRYIMLLGPRAVLRLPRRKRETS